MHYKQFLNSRMNDYSRSKRAPNTQKIVSENGPIFLFIARMGEN